MSTLRDMMISEDLGNARKKSRGTDTPEELQKQIDEKKHKKEKEEHKEAVLKQKS